MPSLNESYDFPDPDHVVPAAIGEPGHRVFSIQLHQADEVVALKCEKQQMIALAEHLEALVADLPPADPPALAGAADLEPAWAIGVIGLAYDRDLDRVIVMAQEVQVIEEDGDEGTEASPTPTDDDAATARIAMTRGQARRFIDTAVELVGAGRPACPICGRPIDPEGHVCPRSNGHSAP